METEINLWIPTFICFFFFLQVSFKLLPKQVAVIFFGFFFFFFNFFFYDFISLYLTILYPEIYVTPPLKSPAKLVNKKNNQNKITLKNFQDSSYAA